MKNLIKFFNLIKSDKKTKILSIITIALLFIFTIGYSLSFFDKASNKKIANIKVNNLSFNMTTNSGESDDRILHLQAGKIEQFDIILTNLNKNNVKYEIIYELCNNSDCTSISKDIPNDILVYKENEETNISGSLESNKSKGIRIITKNKSTNDYYIKLNINAGYSWNELDLVGQIKEVISIDEDINIIAYVDGKEVNELPTTCFYVATSTAYKNNMELTDTTVTFNCNYIKNKWSYTVDNINNLPDKIIVNLENKGINAIEYLTKLQEIDTNNINGLFIDDTKDKNLRYTGANPNNYVEFANTGELWRIVGIFNVTDSNGVTNRNIKLVRDESLGQYSWDATGNDDYGINDWSEADLMQELNGDYLNTNLTANKTNWYNSYLESTTQKPVFRQTGVFDYTKVVKEKYQNMINNSVWNLGGNEYTGSVPYSIPLQSQYTAERGTATYQNIRATTWTGKVGLIYASDYGFASTNAECRNNLRAGVTYINNKYDFSNGKCNTDNWLAKESWYWTLSPYTNGNNLIFGVRGNDAVVDRYSAYITNNVSPSVYLKSDIKFINGIGTKNNPYILK